MRNFTVSPPLSLYIHIPWCVRKCPYCDFNSHAAKGSLPEELYVAALMQELDTYLPQVDGRPIVSIFFGGGTPSLFSASAIENILSGVKQRLNLNPAAEITLEANPGTIDQVNFRDFKQTGINRLSLGVQSLQDDKLQVLGRIHNSANAINAVHIAKEAGFSNFNIDIMYGLPQQSLTDALADLEKALALHPTHFSWYQLTLEPNTLFYKQPPPLPADEILWEMQLQGQALLQQAGFSQYEVSAYAKPQYECRHNRNYWEFGDYLGIGAGAHSKLTDIATHTVTRYTQVKHPNDYLQIAKRKMKATVVNHDDLIFEFMLNALRLTHGVPSPLFSARTGLSSETISNVTQLAINRGLMLDNKDLLCATELGHKFLNDLITLFLVEGN